MPVKVVHIWTCSRCGNEFNPKEMRKSIQQLNWMPISNGGGTLDKFMERDLCQDCTKSLYDWWNQITKA